MKFLPWLNQVKENCKAGQENSDRAKLARHSSKALQTQYKLRACYGNTVTGLHSYTVCNIVILNYISNRSNLTAWHLFLQWRSREVQYQTYKQKQLLKIVLFSAIDVMLQQNSLGKVDCNTLITRKYNSIFQVVVIP